MRSYTALRVAGHALMAMASAVVLLGSTRSAVAFCGCDKPPPPRASVRPFAGYADQVITLFDERLTQPGHYTVQFVARDGSSDWSRAKSTMKRDFADGQPRAQLRVAVPDMAFGPVVINVFSPDGDFIYSLSDDQFTVIAPPIALHDFAETITREDYRTGVAADGTVYVALDMTEMSDATTYTGTAVGVGIRFRPESVGFYNAQGFFGGGLDPSVPGLFRISAGTTDVSDTLSYWRHEFRSYKEEHRKRDARKSNDGEWHLDGTPHVDNFHLLVAIGATLDDGSALVSGATPPFRLVITATPAPQSNL